MAKELRPIIGFEREFSLVNERITNLELELEEEKAVTVAEIEKVKATAVAEIEEKIFSNKK